MVATCSSNRPETRGLMLESPRKHRCESEEGVYSHGCLKPGQASHTHAVDTAPMLESRPSVAGRGLPYPSKG